MKYYKRLIGFELKKVMQKKLFWITFIIFSVMQIFLVCGGYYLGNRYVDGKFLETHMDWYKTDIKNSKNLSGRMIDDKLIKELAEADKYKSGASSDMYGYLTSDDYQNKVRPYEDIEKLVKMITAGNYRTDENVSDGEGAENKITADMLYEIRKSRIEDKWDEYKLTDSEKKYWQSKEDKLKKPFTYKYSGMYSALTGMTGCYYVCMFMIFLIAICLTGIFSDEHVRRTDQIILCTKLGRKETYIAKTVAGAVISIAVTAFYLLETILGFMSIYGSEGFSASVQTSFMPEYSGTLTIGKTFLILVAILFLADILICIITMVLSEMLHSNVAVMAIDMGVLFFLARLVMIPSDYKLLGQIWNLLPLNLLKADQGFFDVRLFDIFGLLLTSWQFGIIVYIIAGILVFLCGKRVYCGFQAGNR